MAIVLSLAIIWKCWWCSNAVLLLSLANYLNANGDDAWQSCCPWQGQNLPVGEERPSSVFWGRNTAAGKYRRRKLKTEKNWDRTVWARNLKFQSGIMRGKEKKTGAKWVKMELRQRRALRKEAKTLQQIFSFSTEKWILSDMVENWKRLTCLQRSGQFLPLLLFARKQIVANGLNTPFREIEENGISICAICLFWQKHFRLLLVKMKIFPL